MKTKHRILWLDDDLESAQTFSGELDTETFVVQLVCSASDLGKRLVDPWDLLITDLQLRSDGWEGLKILADFRRNNKVTPVLVCTGKGAKREVRKSFQLGADGVIFKEDIANDLSKEVNRLVDPHARFNTVIEQFATPIAFLGRRFLEAPSPLEKIRLILDMMETAIKLVTIYCLADLQTTGGWNSEVRQHLNQKILIRPSFGDWVRALRLASSAKEGGQSELCNIVNKALHAQQLLKAIDDAVSVRNLWAHGVTPNDAACDEAVQQWWPILFKLLTRCAPLHTYELLYIDTLERHREGFVAAVLRVIGSSLLLRRDRIECDFPPFTKQMALMEPSSRRILTLHPWLRLESGSALRYSINIYNKTLATSRKDGKTDALADDSIEYLDLLSGGKIKLGQVSEFHVGRT